MAAPHTLLRQVHPSDLQIAAPESQSELPIVYVASMTRERASVRERLARGGATVSVAGDISDAVNMLSARRCALVVVDLAAERAALATIRVLRAQFPSVPVAGLMDPAHPVRAAEAVTAGASDILRWPLDDQDIQAVFADAREGASGAQTNARIDGSDVLFVHSPAMRAVADAIREAAARRTPVLVAGERGSGRALVARTLHGMADEFIHRPFVRIDCAAEGPHELERRIFGAADRVPDAAKSGPEKVSRTGAIVLAQGGTLLLTNIVDAPARVQARLARLLRDREVLSIDANELIALDVRLIAAAGLDVDDAAADGRLRRDLFERLSATRIDVPSLQRRREDIPLLATRFLHLACDAERSAATRFSRGALTLLAALPWSGNAAQLQEVVTAVARDARQAVIRLEDVLAHTSLDGGAAPIESGLNLRDARIRFEREFISSTLQRHHGRVGDAAKALGIQRTNLYRKVRQLGVPKTLLSSHK
jgi:DNA-binding NtrC family response regulator